MRRVEVVDLPALADGSQPPAGVRWRLEPDGDLNANLVSFPAGAGVGEHVNAELDVLIVAVAESERLGYLTVHRRRGRGIAIGGGEADDR